MLSRKILSGKLYEQNEDEFGEELYGSLMLLDSILELMAREMTDQGWKDEQLDVLAEFIIRKGLFEKGKIKKEIVRQSEVIPQGDFPFEMANDQMMQSIGQKPSLFFEEEEIDLPLFKSDKSRKTAFELVKSICQINPKSAHLFTEIVTNFMSEPVWRTKKKSDWSLSVVMQKAKSRTGYVGMKNLGNTCYMNSLMQQMFMIPLFRQQIMEIDTKT